MIKLVTQWRQRLRKLVQKDATMENNNQQPFMYTEDQLMARLKFFIGICLALTLTGIVFVVLYSIIFVTQPLNAISPIDSKFFELIIPIATFLTGTLSGIMLAGGNKDAQMKALEAANKGWDNVPSTPAPTSGGGFSASASFGGSSMSFNKPATGAFTAPTASAGMAMAPSAFTAAPAQPVMSATGKPMPIQDPEPEL
jgi:hypothetical protein